MPNTLYPPKPPSVAPYFPPAKLWTFQTKKHAKMTETYWKHYLTRCKVLQPSFYDQDGSMASVCHTIGNKVSSLPSTTTTTFCRRHTCTQQKSITFFNDLNQQVKTLFHPSLCYLLESHVCNPPTFPRSGALRAAPGRGPVFWKENSISLIIFTDQGWWFTQQIPKVMLGLGLG